MQEPLTLCKIRLLYSIGQYGTAVVRFEPRVFGESWADRLLHGPPV